MNAKSSFFFFHCSLLFVLFFAISLFAEPLKPDQYVKPAAQDSVYKTPWGIDPAARETDAGRWVLPHREVMQRTYDIAGQKSEWILGTSILGAPELDPDHMGMGSIQSRYPSKLAGLFTTRLGYDGNAFAFLEKDSVFAI